ncbi:hypothetical protein SAMN02745823_02500 [Sporobacter termitidis DSM 10068]|uniref:DUF4179 domain-containing protein n=1 Tax=Sporobacter termitidis DSM 10068 TaxID=1123282 RepID=A0A1M5YHN6_9FIRM|nr:hypothetical protein [Sporobacter termitidis]SHI11013.1 hypothetical protein SAMN02745823_02500 [Sporobacter termitidis DSM 10068]
MKSYDILYGLGNIQSEFISEAALMSSEKRSDEHKKATWPRRIAVAVLAAVFLTTGVAFAAIYKPNFFSNWFASQITGSNKGSLSSLDSGDAGVVVDNALVKIEAIDAIQSGHVQRAGFLVTLKKLDSVLIKNSIPTLKGYRFENVSIDGGVTEQIEYDYADTHPELKNNQYLFIITHSINEDTLDNLQCSMQNIGFYNENGKYVPYLSGEWSWEFSFKSASSTGSVFHPDYNITIGDISCEISRLRLSMFGFEVICSVNNWKGREWNPNDFDPIIKKAVSMVVTLEDGSLLPVNTSAGQGGMADWDGTIVINTLFDEPTPINNIKSIDVLGIRVTFADSQVKIENNENSKNFNPTGLTEEDNR